MKKIDWNIPVISFIALFLRVFNILGEVMVCDEGLIIAPVFNFFERGILPFRNWHHPPLRYFFLYLSSKFLGEDILAYRFHSIIFGVGSVILLYFLALKIFKSKEIAALSSLFLATDPLHTAFSRLAIEDSQLTFFILLSLLLTLKYSEKRESWLLIPIGFTLGLSIATKWLSLPIYLAVVLYVVYLNWNETFRKIDYLKITNFFICLILLPLSTYLFAFLPWFQRGYTLNEWLNFQLLMARSAGGVSPTDYGHLIGLSHHAFKWFIFPISFSYSNVLEGSIIKSVTGFIHPPLWLLFVPAFIYLLRSEESEKFYFLSASIFLFIFPLILMNRPVYLYSATSFTPFVALITATFFYKLREKNTKYAQIIDILLVIIICYSLFLFPLEAEIPVPYRLYQPLLNIYALFS